jgi:signal transduction histidine kinase
VINLSAVEAVDWARGNELTRLITILTRTCGVDPVLMNPPKLQRVLYNLVSHALHHTPADGTVALHAEHDGEVVRVEVAATGEGTVTQDLLHAFE